MKTIAEKKPPLVPSKLRPPLRRITNFLPPPSPSYRTVSKGPTLAIDKENIARPGAAANSRSLMKPRRISIATGRAPPSTGQFSEPAIICKGPTEGSVFQTFLPNAWIEGSIGNDAVAMKTSSKFMGSPPTQQVGSWKPKHPTVVALQRSRSSGVHSSGEG
ncbi:hypothetical protein EUGRSUZ_L01545 [Eucalyptus grandis]|uniref:Uncharacterized protein n=1 Tax=Eucalyptus grandis TaxID=71139 RepID=A0A058ZV34_EUCGR|nr:hypothetical protein EUGRSUZ_L01545 [Eucalyptus grandis]